MLLPYIHIVMTEDYHPIEKRYNNKGLKEVLLNTVKVLRKGSCMFHEHQKKVFFTLTVQILTTKFLLKCLIIPID